MGMEIPHANKYETVKDSEKLPDVGNDFLNEKLKLDFIIEQEVFDNLPKITDNDLKTRMEAYRYFIGEFQNIDKNEAVVNILGVVEEVSNVKKQLYLEMKEEVLPVVEAIKNRVEDISKYEPEFKNSELVGDIHTHPGTKESQNLDAGQNVWDPSEQDVKAIIKLYEDGTIPRSKLFIFGIVGRDGEDTVYAFYRLVQQNHEYEVEKLKTIKTR